MKLFALYQQAAATHIDKLHLLQFAVENGKDYCLDLALPISTFDQIVAAFRAKGWKRRLKPLVDAQCSSLSMVLDPNVMGIVYEYLFGVHLPDLKPSSEDEAAELLTEAWAKVRKRGEWFNAARNGDEQLVAQLLAEDPALVDVKIDGDWVDSIGPSWLPCDQHLILATKPKLDEANGMTALHLAVVRGQENVVQFLFAASPSLGLWGNNCTDASSLAWPSQSGGTHTRCVSRFS